MSSPLRLKTWMSDRRLALSLLIPGLIITAILIVYPLVRLLLYSLYDIKLFALTDAESEFVLFKNYIDVISDKDFLLSLYRGIVWTAGVNILQLFFGVVISLLLYEDFPGRNFLRGMILFPYLLPTVVAVLSFKYMFHDHFGIINFILPFVDGLGMGNIKFALVIVIFIGAWKLFPFTVILVLARLQTISPELYEAARIDGSNKLSEIFRITLPMIKPVLIIDLLLRTIWTFNYFDLIWLLTKGGPVTATEIPPIMLYREAFLRYDLGRASAMGAFLALLLFTSSVLYMRWYERTTEDY